MQSTESWSEHFLTLVLTKKKFRISSNKFILARSILPITKEVHLMRKKGQLIPVAGLFLLVGAMAFALISVPSGSPAVTTVSTLVKFPLQTEGLTGDGNGNLYTASRNAGAGVPCPVWRVGLGDGIPTVVGYIPTLSTTVQCVTSGLALDEAGDVFVAADGRIYRFTPDDASPPTATVFAAGVPGANGVAFDRDGNLWVSDGVTGQGRVWKISPSGVVALQFRVQPMRNDDALGGLVTVPGDGVGRQIRTFPPGNLTNALGFPGDSIVANGLAFDQSGALYVADTARGAIWKVEFNPDGSLRSPVGCDTTFAPDTLCLSNVLAQHPLLESADGIALDYAGNIWASVNARNAIVVVSRDGKVEEAFRNPADGTTMLRNGGPLEFPASPFLLGKRFCTVTFDVDARDNSPNSAGELNAANPIGEQPGVFKGAISCIDQDLGVPGLPLPVK